MQMRYQSRSCHYSHIFYDIKLKILIKLNDKIVYLYKMYLKEFKAPHKIRINLKY